MNIAPVIVLGWLLLGAGFWFTVRVHYSMGEAWRSGIDPEGPAKLLTTGYFRLSRNPMFLGVAISQLGFFLALPSAFSLLCLVVGLLTLRSQALLEERHLQQRFPLQYSTYSKAVHRWI